MDGPKVLSGSKPESQIDRSAKSSRSTSPVRGGRTVSNTEQNHLSRNSSSHASPTRQSNVSSSTTPSAAALQRALAATSSNANSNSNSRNNEDTFEGSSEKRQRSIPSWPTSPRLKSPPPTTFRSITGRIADNEQALQPASLGRITATPMSEVQTTTGVAQDPKKEQGSNHQNHVTRGRLLNASGTGLETVAEGSVPTTPSIGPVSNRHETSNLQVSTLEQDSDHTKENSTSRDAASSAMGNTAPKLVPEKAETAPSSRAPSASRPAANLAKRSFTSLTGKSKPVVEPLRTMTVETETVNSTPQIINDRVREGGSVRTKPSSETIRPKKDKKKTSRKTPSLHAGMNSSKADIFEAKVASAVDEADSSDSEETFVYESNPPEQRHSRHHSRTPSANSITSQLDYHGVRGKHGVRGGSSAVSGKKSMKFTSSTFGNQLEPDSLGDGRSSTRTTGSTTKHHHIGRHGRNGYASVIDTDSTFGQGNRYNSPRTPTTRSKPNSPRTSNGHLHLSRKSTAAGYDTYDDGADDERAPLIGPGRVNRNRHSRRPNSSHLRAMDFGDDPRRGCWPRVGGCVLLGLLITLICVGVAVFVVALNRPLLNVEIKRIENVLASEQELMLDLHVRATNLNVFAISVNDLDVDLFAESPYVGTTRDWEDGSPPLRASFVERRRAIKMQARKIPYWFPPYHSDDGVDEGTDPIDDPAPGTQKMLLGRILEFDSPLVFDPSPIRRNEASSVGQIRLHKPGNKTEVGGSARWERIIQHPFDLIVRGVLKYQLPLSSTTRSAKLSGRIAITPGKDDSDESGAAPPSDPATNSTAECFNTCLP